MDTRDQAVKTAAIILAFMVCALLAIMLLLPPMAEAAPSDIPPRTPRPTKPAPPEGAPIVLCASFGDTWSFYSARWQELWTVVQWQDEWGYWHDVEEWQGTLDKVKADENGEVVGEKGWWVAEADLGKGPFRWLVYRSEGSTLLATSESFNLPASRHEVVKVEVSLAP